MREADLRNRLTIKLLLAVILVLLLFPFAGPDGKPAASRPYPRPKLVLVLIIDQLRFDYLVRFHPQFVEGGFNLLLSGANFVNCRYDYATTITCPGHATLSTGAYPNMHGIIANEWYDRSAHHLVNCVEDRDTLLVSEAEIASPASGGNWGASPRNLKGSTLGDELRIASNFRSKVVAVSLKDRGAVVPGGHTANAAYWYDLKNGQFISSTYYMSKLPRWVARFNADSPARAYCGRSWQALPETPGATGKVLKEFKPTANEPCPDEKFLTWLHITPFMNEIELNFALAALKNENLGQGSETDLLAVSLSVNDYIGHSFGPYSPEVADVTLWTDRYLADFFNQLDQLVGLKNVWIALSADHGEAPNPRFIKDHRLGMGNAQPVAIRNAVQQALVGSFGQDEWIEEVSGFNIYLNKATLKKHHVNPAKAEEVASEAAETIPGVEAAFTRTQLSKGMPGASPLARKASNSFSRWRSGDIFLVLEPFAVPVQGQDEGTHGSPWSYDSQVPLILWGEAFIPGNYSFPCQPIDLAPTLAAALGLERPSGAEGQPLTPALK